jgi:hypothetical protein
MKDFEIAFGSVSGSDHRRSDKNNQDAIYCQETENSIVAVICDGCSEGKHSEIGARLGANILTQHIRHYFSDCLPNPWLFHDALESSRIHTIAQLRELAKSMSSEKELTQLIIDCFLFTVIGVYIDNRVATIFSIGDGVHILNDVITELGPFPNNEPPYLAYGGLIKSSEKDLVFDLRQQIFCLVDGVNSILIGTDGVTNLIKSSNSKIPGKNELVGDISQFWADDRYFINKDMVRRKLSLVNREIITPAWDEHFLSREKGLLPDDTSLVVIRRKR